MGPPTQLSLHLTFQIGAQCAVLPHAGALKAGRSSSSSGAAGMQQESRESLKSILSMYPQFAHDMPAEDVEQMLASCGEIHVGSLEDLEALLLQREVDTGLSQSDAEPKQEQASGSQQEAGAQSASGQSSELPKPAGGGSKKRNRKKGGSKAAQGEQLTGRGIMDSPPAPAGPPAAKVPQPPPSLVDPSDGAPASGAPTAVSAPEPKRSLSPAEQHSQPDLEVHAPTEVEPEGFLEGPGEAQQAKGVPVNQPKVFVKPDISLEGLHISGRADSEGEVYHDAASGIESPAQSGGQGSRRASLDSSDSAWPQYSSAGKRFRLAYGLALLLHTHFSWTATL